MYAGKTAPLYFVARLTMNNPNSDLEFGDRILAMF
jgi:hypothetical protein